MIVAHELKDSGGMERTLWELLRHQHHAFDFVVVSSALSANARPWVCEWHPVEVPGRPFILRFVAFAAVAAGVVRRNPADLVLTMGAIVPNRVDVASVQFCHRGYRDATGRWSTTTGPRIRRLNAALVHIIAAIAESWCYRRGRVRAMITPSHGAAEELQRHFPTVPHHVVADGVDLDRFGPPAEVAARVPGARVRALFVGGDWFRKGLDLAIAGVAYATERGADIDLVVDGGGDVGHFTRLAERAGVADRVRFVGVTPDVRASYRDADLFLLPTSYETFCLSAHEAAACGLPIIASPASGVTELIGDGASGILVEREGSSIGEALLALCKDDAQRAAMGAEAARRAAAYSWDRYAAGVATVLEGLLASARGETR
jgi:glycosyltransferase involved in cell wall biosynthesis